MCSSCSSHADPYLDWPTRFPDRRAFGYLCTYAPLEVLHAAGFTPLRLMQSSGQMALVDAHLPSFACALARAVTETMLSGQLDFVEGVLFPHTCDTLQCLADIWRMAKPCFRVVTFSLPSVLTGSGARDYLLAELRHLAAILESEFESPVTEEALRGSIALYNRQRRLLSDLYAQRNRLSAQHLWSLTSSAMLMPVEDHNTLLESSLHAAGAAGEVARAGPAVVLVGAVLDEPSIPVLVEELGGRVVGDDLCTGSRYFDQLVDEVMEPFEALAERYVQRAHCPAKHHSRQTRAERLLALVRNAGAQGVVFVLPKFCDPHAFDYVPLSQELDSVGIPHLLIETELTMPSGQLRTRVQAFLELLRSSVV